MEHQTTVSEVETRPPWMDSAEKGQATLRKIMAVAEQKREEPRIVHAYNSDISSAERREIHTDFFFAGQLAASFPEAQSWFSIVLSENYLQGLGTQMPMGAAGARNLVNIAKLTDFAEQQQLVEDAQIRVPRISRVHHADHETWPWPIQSLFVHEIGSQLQGGNFNNIQLLAQAGFYGRSGEHHAFLQELVRTLPERNYSLDWLAAKMTMALPGRRYNKAYVPYLYDPEPPDHIAVIGSAMKLFRQKEDEHMARALSGHTAAQLTSIALENTLAYVARFGQHSNAQPLLARLRNDDIVSHESVRQIPIQRIVAVASGLSAIAMPEGLSFRPFASTSSNLLPATDRILFAATQLGAAREAYWQDPSLQRVVKTMQDAIWTVGKHVVASQSSLPTVAESLAHHALTQPPDEAMRLAHELGKPESTT